MFHKKGTALFSAEVFVFSCTVTFSDDASCSNSFISSIEISFLTSDLTVIALEFTDQSKHLVMAINITVRSADQLSSASSTYPYIVHYTDNS